MLPRHAYLSATMLALAATMIEEDSPVVPSPEPDEGATLGHEGPESHWSSVLGRAILDDMRADEAAQEGSHYDLDAGQGHGYDGRYEPDETHLGIGRLALEVDRDGGGTYVNLDALPDAHMELCRRDINTFTEYVLRDEVKLCKVAPNKWAALNRHDARPEQREHKKARAKRKAKKGWA